MIWASQPRMIFAYRVTLTLAVLAGVLTSLAPTTAFAHGERAQEANLRTRTISFYDVRFSDTTLRQGDPLTITGRFYVPRSWPQGIEEPKIAALTVAAPGPVVLMKDRRIDGEFVPQTIKLEKGRSYGFRMDLVARRTGRFHIHPMITVKFAGPMVGPGVYLNLSKGSGGRYAENNVTLRNGETVDLETFNVSNTIVWQLLFALLGTGFVAYWFSRPLVQRMATLSTGAEPGDLITKRDLKVTGAFAVIAIGLVVASAIYAAQKWPDGVPLQVRKDIPKGVDAGRLVTSKATAPALFSETEDTLRVKLKLRNATDQQLTATEFVSGGFAFRPLSGATEKLESATPIKLSPGESRNVEFSLISKVWSEQKLIPHAEVEVAFGGVLLFEAPDGSQELAEVGSPVLIEGEDTSGSDGNASDGGGGTHY